MPPDTRLTDRTLRFGLAGLTVGSIAAAIAASLIVLCATGMRCIGATDHWLFAAFIAGGVAIASAAICAGALWRHTRTQRKLLGM